VGKMPRNDQGKKTFLGSTSASLDLGLTEGARPALAGRCLAIDEARPSVRPPDVFPCRPKTGRGCNHSL
jgi:hypothetical protein